MKPAKVDVPLNARRDKSNSNLRMTQIPIEWMGVGAWRLPSGKALVEFALQAGFLAPLLLGNGPFWSSSSRTAGRKHPIDSASERMTRQPR